MDRCLRLVIIIAVFHGGIIAKYPRQGRKAKQTGGNDKEGRCGCQSDALSDGYSGHVCDLHLVIPVYVFCPLSISNDILTHLLFFLGRERASPILQQTLGTIII